MQRIVDGFIGMPAAERAAAHRKIFPPRNVRDSTSMIRRSIIEALPDFRKGIPPLRNGATETAALYSAFPSSSRFRGVCARHAEVGLVGEASSRLAGEKYCPRRD